MSLFRWPSEDRIYSNQRGSVFKANFTFNVNVFLLLLMWYQHVQHTLMANYFTFANWWLIRRLSLGLDLHANFLKIVHKIITFFHEIMLACYSSICITSLMQLMTNLYLIIIIYLHCSWIKWGFPEREIDIFTCIDVAIVHHCNSAQLAAANVAHTADFEIVHLYLPS